MTTAILNGPELGIVGEDGEVRPFRRASEPDTTANDGDIAPEISLFQRHIDITDIVKEYRVKEESDRLTSRFYTGNTATSSYSDKDPNDTFLFFMGSYRILEPEEEKELFGYIESGYKTWLGIALDETPSRRQSRELIGVAAAFDAICITNLRLVYHYAKTEYDKRKNITGFTNIELSDVIQEASIGLSSAITRFDVGRGNKFSTYATPWIMQGINRLYQNQGRAIRLPQNIHEDMRLIDAARGRLLAINREHPSEEEIMREAGLSPDAYKKAIAASSIQVVPIEDRDQDEKANPHLALVSPEDPTSGIENSDIVRYIIKIAEEVLGNTEAAILSAYIGLILPHLIDKTVEFSSGKQISYGDLMGTYGLTHRDIAEITEMSATGIGRICRGALEKIKNSLKHTI